MARPANITLCSFCGKSHAEVKKLIAGPGVFICDNCVIVCKQVLDKEFAAQNKKRSKASVAKPAEIKRQLDLTCVGQEHAKKTLAVAVHNHYKRIFQERPEQSAGISTAHPDPHAGQPVSVVGPPPQETGRVVIMLLSTVGVSAPATAHHSAARFVLAQSVTVNGVVARYEWANPHVYIFVTEIDAAGEAVEWEIEGQPPAMMRRVGWSRETLAVGDAVRLTGAPSRNPSSKSLLLQGLQKAGVALFDGPMVGTHHASGDLGWMRLATPVWGFLEERLDRRIAVSEQARESAQRWLPGEYEIVPNGVLIPAGVEPGGREHRVVFAGRQEPRKGLQILLRAWPEIRRRTGARLRIAGADPLAVRLLLTRLRVSDDGIDVLGFLTQDALTAELASAKALVAPSLGGESFGMVLTRAFACATPVVASDIPGYRDVMTPETSVAVAPGDPEALTDAIEALLADEAGRVALGAAGRQLAIDRYSWQDIARRLERIYDSARGTAAETVAA